MWFQVDKEALEDWRIARLAELLGVSFGDAFYLCSRVWCRLYERGGGLMPATEVDTVARRKGLADFMVESELADATPDGLRIKGDERACKFSQFRIEQKRKSALAVEARIGNGIYKEPPGGVPAGLPADDPSISISSGDLFPDLSPESGSGKINHQAKARARAKEAADIWLEWFNRRFGRAFKSSQELQKLVGALLTRGYSEKPDMRGVALYLRSQWEDDDKMRPFLVPSTILRPTKFAERLDLAREWAREAAPSLWGGSHE